MQDRAHGAWERGPPRCRAHCASAWLNGSRSRLRSRAVWAAAPHRPGWVADADFDIAEHVGAAPVDAPLDTPALLALIAQLFEQRLDRSRPLWRIDTVALSDGASALIWRIHHSLADGTASVRYARALLWDDETRRRA